MTSSFYTRMGPLAIVGISLCSMILFAIVVGVPLVCCLSKKKKPHRLIVPTTSIALPDVSNTRMPAREINTAPYPKQQDHVEPYMYKAWSKEQRTIRKTPPPAYSEITWSVQKPDDDLTTPSAGSPVTGNTS